MVGTNMPSTKAYPSFISSGGVDQLFRFSLDLLHRLFAGRPARATPGDPAGAGLFQRVCSAGDGRRTELQGQSPPALAVRTQATTRSVTGRLPGHVRHPHDGGRRPLTKSNCLLRGIPGDYSRASAEIDWRRTFTTSNGMQITPFFQLRGDVASLDVQNQPGVANYIAHRSKRACPRHAGRRR